MDRVAALLPAARNKSATTNMQRLLNTLTPSTIVPELDKYYVFVYKAKTSGIRYDQHPLVVVTGIYQWGFTGLNFHWNEIRRYSWGEVLSNLYVVNDEELNSVEQMPIALFKQS